MHSIRAGAASQVVEEVGTDAGQHVAWSLVLPHAYLCDGRSFFLSMSSHSFNRAVAVLLAFLASCGDVLRRRHYSIGGHGGARRNPQRSFRPRGLEPCFGNLIP